ncbi:MAG: SusC/RagA family TonB-linked outer membrane protein, partial [Bacteroidales bacterium]
SMDILKKQNLFWNMTLMGSTVSNKVLNLADKPEIISGSYIIKEGEALNSFYLAESAGIDPATGNKLYWVWDEVDGVPGDKYITSDYQKALQSRHVAGNRIPDLYGSWSNDIKYRNFDLNILTTYSLGGKMLDGVYNTLLYNTYVGQAGHKDRLNKSWREPGDLAEYPRIDGNGSAKITRTSDELFDASYFAIKNITLGYSLPSKLVKSINMESVRVTFTVDNLHVFTTLKGMDPQYNFTGGTGYSYTPSRTISMGLDIRF